MTHLRRGALICAWLVLALLGSGQSVAHPQDGPHADIRIAIDEHGVEFDFIMNLALLDELAATGRETPSDIHPLEEGQVRAGLLEYFAAEHEVRVDGEVVEPQIRNFMVVRPSEEMLPLFPRSGIMGLRRVRFELVYPADGPPQRVAMRWGRFPFDPIRSPEDGPAESMVFEAQLRAEGRFQLVQFTQNEPEFIWHATGETPESRFQEVPQLTSPPSAPPRAIPGGPLAAAVLGALVVGVVGAVRGGRAARRSVLAVAPAAVVGGWLVRDLWPIPVGPAGVSVNLPSEAEAMAAFRPLHANVYRAFDYTEEGEIYDALARSAQGELLDALYNDVYRSLIMYEEGGAVSTVDTVDLLDAEVESIGLLEGGDPSYVVTARWQVRGVVYHFGHSHWRLNEHRARYLVVDRGEGWRIADMTSLEQFRVDSGSTDPTAPQAAPSDDLPFGEL